MVRIVLIDDHPMVRGGLRTTLSVEPSWQVVAEAADGQSGLALVNQLQPDLLILDLQMPGMSGLEVLQAIRQSAPNTRVILFTMHAEDAYVREALAQGAAGYVLKDAQPSELITAIQQTLQGGRSLSPSLAARLIDAYLQQPPAAPPSLDWADMLTTRERQVLLLAAQGLSNPEIGERLVISPRTAETHRTNLMRKLGLKHQAELVTFAQTHHLFQA